MATKKTSKTAHVMNLLIKPETDAVTENGEENTVYENSIPAAKMPQADPVGIEQEEDAKISRQLQHELEALLEEETASTSQTQSDIEVTPDFENVETFAPEDFATPEPEIEPETEPIPEIEPAPKTKPAPETKPTAPIIDNSMSRTKPQYNPTVLSKPDPNAKHDVDISSLQHEHDDYICVNVIEEIVSIMLPDIMQRFSLCECPKCKADVTALALNSLSPKYVGTYKGTLFVKLASYEKQYSTDILTALTRACIHVKQNPRH